MGEPRENEPYEDDPHTPGVPPQVAGGAEAARDEAGEGATGSVRRDRRPRTDGEPDVLLDVPRLSVDEIELHVERLRARVALQTGVADVLNLHVGADVDLDGVELEIKGVEAEAGLKVRLGNVEAIIERVLRSIDENPEIVEASARKLPAAAEGVVEGTAEGSEGPGDTAEAESPERGAEAEETGEPAESEAPEEPEEPEVSEGSGEPDDREEPEGSEAPEEQTGPESGGEPEERDDSGEPAGSEEPAEVQAAEGRVTGELEGDEDGGHLRDESGDSADERWSRIRNEAKQIRRASRKRFLKGIGSGAKQVGREVGGVASRVVRAVRNPE